MCGTENSEEIGDRSRDLLVLVIVIVIVIETRGSGLVL